MYKRLTLILSLVLTGCITVREAPAPASTDPNCKPEEVRSFLQQADSAMTRLTTLATKFQQTETADEAPPIIEETQELFADVMLMNPPECAHELHINLSLAVANIGSAMSAITEGDMDLYNRSYGVYQIAADKANEEYERLRKIVGQ